MAAEIGILGEIVRIASGVCTCTDEGVQEQAQRTLDIARRGISEARLPDPDLDYAHILLDWYGGVLISHDPPPAYRDDVLY